MGRFVLRYRRQQRESKRSANDTLSYHRQTTSREAASSSKTTCRDSLFSDRLDTEYGMMEDIWVIASAQLCEALELRLVKTLPDITEDEITDRSRADILVQLLALLQVTWMATQLLVRAILHKPSSQLELMTLSFAICAFAIYLILIKHPKAIRAPVYIDIQERMSPYQEMRLLRFRLGFFWGT